MVYVLPTSYVQVQIYTSGSIEYIERQKAPGLATLIGECASRTLRVLQNVRCGMEDINGSDLHDETASPYLCYRLWQCRVVGNTFNKKGRPKFHLPFPSRISRLQAAAEMADGRY